MSEQHPITPPPELVRQWLGEFFGCTVSGELSDSERYLATQAARWGADQQLEACLKWFRKFYKGESWMLRDLKKFRDTMRPKPPSLADHATIQLDEAVMRGDCISTTEAMPVIRAALKRLKELELVNS